MRKFGDVANAVINGLSAASDIAGNIYGIVNNEREFEYQKEIDAFNQDMAQKNYQLAVDQMNWQQQAQQTAWSREDNAIRRRVADLESAGMSKWLAAGQAAQAGGVTASNVASGANLINSGAKLKDVNLKNAVDSFLTGAERQSDISRTQAEADLIDANIENVKQDTINKSEGVNKVVAETEYIAQQTENALQELNLAQQRFEEEKKLWESQRNKNTAEAKVAKQEMLKTRAEAEIKLKEYKAFNTYFKMAQEKHAEEIKNSKNERRNRTANTIRASVRDVSNVLSQWLPFGGKKSNPIGFALD